MKGMIENAVNVLSVGKYKNSPELNEDRFVATSHTFAVIDGSAPRVPVKFDGKSGGQFAADVVKEVLEASDPDINGPELVALITNRLNEQIDNIGARNSINQVPESRPAALFTAARINGNKLIVTALGDIHCRINGQIIHSERLITEEMMIEKRIAAMRSAKSQNPDLSDDELRNIGRAAIDEDLKAQVKNYFNNPDDPLGLGIIDGNPVPEKFIHVYEFDLAEIRTFELFSDGYYVIPQKAEIEAWEKAFLAAEKKDPLRWKKYPAVKAATPDQFSDDRTILIAKVI